MYKQEIRQYKIDNNVVYKYKMVNLQCQMSSRNSQQISPRSPKNTLSKQRQLSLLEGRYKSRGTKQNLSTYLHVSQVWAQLPMR